MAWFGNSEGHRRAGRKGGKAQSKKTNPGNFANDRKKAREAGKKGGEAINRQHKAIMSAKNKKV